MRRIIVGVSGSPGSLHALRCAVIEARLRDSAIWSVMTWIPKGGELANQHAPCPQLMRIWRDDAAKRLNQAWDDALGGVPPDLNARLFVPRGSPGQRLVQIADHESDLLVIGAGTSCALGRLVKGSVPRYCLRHARCAVLTVPPSRLERQLAHHPLARWRIARELSR
jgi:nucleotide-binding universal stress UspA family protein